MSRVVERVQSAEHGVTATLGHSKLGPEAIHGLRRDFVRKQPAVFARELQLFFPRFLIRDLI